MKGIWVFNEKKKMLMFFSWDGKSKTRRPAEIFEVNGADIIIDPIDGRILEIHIPVNNEEIIRIIELLKKKGLITEKQ